MTQQATLPDSLRDRGRVCDIKEGDTVFCRPSAMVADRNGLLWLQASSPVSREYDRNWCVLVRSDEDGLHVEARTSMQHRYSTQLVDYAKPNFLPVATITVTEP